MDGATLALLYSLLLSLSYRAIVRVIANKLSSVEGFMLVYLIAIYAPIYISLAKASPLALLIPLSLHIFSIIYVINSRCDTDFIIRTNVYASMAFILPLLIIGLSGKP
ncbi:MAG: hypothetical protein QXI22_06850 [Sulfolobales archaeon]